MRKSHGFLFHTLFFPFLFYFLLQSHKSMIYLTRKSHIRFRIVSLLSQSHRINDPTCHVNHTSFFFLFRIVSFSLRTSISMTLLDPAHKSRVVFFLISFFFRIEFFLHSLRSHRSMIYLL